MELVAGSKSLPQKLDVGCGPHCLPDAFGLDQFDYPGVNAIHNLNEAPWPLPEKQFSFIRCQHVIEHIRDLSAFSKEIHRVCSHGGRIKFITPHYSSYASWGDPTHLFHFAYGSIPQLFTQNVGAHRFRVVENRIKFTGAVLDFPGWLISKISMKTYEKHFAWIFPANEIHTEIEVLHN